MKIKAIHEIYYTGKDGKRAVAEPGTEFEPVGDMQQPVAGGFRKMHKGACQAV